MTIVSGRRAEPWVRSPRVSRTSGPGVPWCYVALDQPHKSMGGLTGMNQRMMIYVVGAVVLVVLIIIFATN